MADLQSLARAVAANLTDPDRKQLRFNEIVSVAFDFYANPAEGVAELVDACDRGSPLYKVKSPMWRDLREQYAWMTA